MADDTFFDLPTLPDRVSVPLAPANLRRIDFSGLDFDTARRAIIEYIQKYYPDDFNDFIASNGIIMLVEIIAAVTAKLSLRADLLSNEAFLPTATSEESVINHLALINQKIKRATPATVDVECTVDLPLFTSLNIAAGTSFSVVGPDNSEMFYEIYSAPGDWNSNIVISPGKKGVIAWGVEGRFVAPAIFQSSGGANQSYVINDNNILDDPIFVDVSYGAHSSRYAVVDFIENYGPNDNVAEVLLTGSVMKIKFGDDITGKAPLSGSMISVRYRVGGGRRGRIGVSAINTSKQLIANPPANTAVTVNFRNITASIGGTDKESLDRAKKRAPRDFAVQSSIVTSSDYAHTAENFSHPAFGIVLKAVAAVRTSVNANLVEIYILASGEDDIPTMPSIGLKRALETYIDDLNVMTDKAVVLDGSLKPIDIDMNVIVDRNADASIIRNRVEYAMNTFFDVDSWDMGEAFYISNLIESIESIDGVSYVDLFKPANNILSIQKLSSDFGTDDEGVAIDQLIVRGSVNISYYYNK